MNACSDGDENSPGEKKEVPRPHPYQYDVRVGGICYTLVPKARVAKVSPGDVYYAGNIIIPSTIEHEGTVYQVEEISDSAFCGCRNLTAIVIPNSVKQIGLWTFAFCTSLVQLPLHDYMTGISPRAFYNCTSLTSITIPSSIQDIGELAFGGCSGLTTVNWSAIKINPGTFADCTSLSEFVIPEGVKEIRSDAFARCKNLALVKIPSSVGTISYRAFSGCENLKDVYYDREKLPDYCPDNIFENAYINYATLHVPATAIEEFRATAPWSEFGNIVPID